MLKFQLHPPQSNLNNLIKYDHIQSFIIISDYTQSIPIPTLAGQIDPNVPTPLITSEYTQSFGEV